MATKEQAAAARSQVTAICNQAVRDFNADKLTKAKLKAYTARAQTLCKAYGLESGLETLQMLEPGAK